MEKAISFADILGRPPIDWGEEDDGVVVKSRRVLITGAGGSIGVELCMQIASNAPQELILMGRGEHSIYQIHRTINDRFPELNVRPVLVDIQNIKALRASFQKYSPDIIFHAAAYKHVPLLESHPCEAVLNNVLGTQNLISAARDCFVDRMVFISTDKAVEPCSILGVTKKLCELMLFKASFESNTDLVTARFGNVFRTSGSAVTLFEEQALNGGPITITDPAALRFFMDIEDAGRLVLRAARTVQNGKVAVLDTGDAISMGELAKCIVASLNSSSGKEIVFETIGLRPGEKRIEKLVTDRESVHAIDQKPLMCVTTDLEDINYTEEKLKDLTKYALDRDELRVVSLLDSFMFVR